MEGSLPMFIPGDTITSNPEAIRGDIARNYTRVLNRLQPFRNSSRKLESAQKNTKGSLRRHHQFSPKIKEERNSTAIQHRFAAVGIVFLNVGHVKILNHEIRIQLRQALRQKQVFQYG